MVTHDLVITPGGELRFIYNDDLQPMLGLGSPNVTRASFVEPTADGQWTADMSPVGGGVLGPYRLRSEALADEVAYLKGVGY